MPRIAAIEKATKRESDRSEPSGVGLRAKGLSATPKTPSKQARERERERQDLEFFPKESSTKSVLHLDQGKASLFYALAVMFMLFRMVSCQEVWPYVHNKQPCAKTGRLTVQTGDRGRSV